MKPMSAERSRTDIEAFVDVPVRRRLVAVFELARLTSIIEWDSLISNGKTSEWGPMLVVPRSLMVVINANGIGKKEQD
jgi:hypothetical protein